MAEMVSITGPGGGVGLYNAEQAKEVLKQEGFRLTRDVLAEAEATKEKDKDEQE